MSTQTQSPPPAAQPNFLSRTINVQLTKDKEAEPMTVSDLAREFRRRHAEVLRHKPVEDGSLDKIMAKYPRLTAHLICQSLGYFCPRSAANAIRHYLDAQPFYCEWYCSWGSSDMLEVGKNVLKRAVENRHSHYGYMSEYWQGRMVVMQSLMGNDPLFASWF